MNPRRIGAVALVTLAAPATAALAAETDTFRGHTEGAFFSHGEYRQAKISFERTGSKLHHIRFEIRVRCPSGQHRSRVVRMSPGQVRDGRFRIEQGVTGIFDGTNGSEEFHSSSLFRGRIHGDNAAGVVQFSTELDAKGHESASGRTCRSGKVEWSARAA
jgi:hypothetical protein